MELLHGRTSQDAGIEALAAVKAFLEASQNPNGQEDKVIALLEDPMVQAFLAQNLPKLFRGQPTQAHLISLVREAAKVSDRIREAIRNCADSSLLPD